MSAPSTSAGDTKRTVINTVDPVKKKEKTNKIITTSFRIALTLFYGQFLANGIYDNLIRTIPYLVESPPPVYSIIKVTIGVLIIALCAFAIAAIWLRQRILIFISAILLIVLSITSLIISIIDIVSRKERKTITEKEFAADICELCVQALFRVGAIVLKFLMIKILRPDAQYQQVPTRA